MSSVSLVSRGTFGVTLDAPIGSWSASEERLVEQATAAGAGTVRAPGMARDLAAISARTRDVGFVAVCSAAAACADVAADPAPSPEGQGPGGYLELTLATPEDVEALTENELKVASLPLMLGLDVPLRAEPPVHPPRFGEEILSQFAAVGARVEESADLPDPQRLEAGLRALAAPLRERGWRHPIWLTELSPPPSASADEQVSWLIKFGAHTLALGIQRLFLRLPEERPAPALRALGTMSVWLEGSQRITWLARGQYRAEFTERPNRYLLWRDPALNRLPSSLQGPLSVRDMSGQERRVETTRLKLTDDPVLVERL